MRCVRARMHAGGACDGTGGAPRPRAFKGSHACGCVGCSAASSRFLPFLDPLFNCSFWRPQLVDDVVRGCPIDTRRALYGCVVLAGGTTRLKNFGRRMQVGGRRALPLLYLHPESSGAWCMGASLAICQERKMYVLLGRTTTQWCTGAWYMDPGVFAPPAASPLTSFPASQVELATLANSRVAPGATVGVDSGSRRLLGPALP